MYAPANIRQFSRIVATLLAVGVLSACGYKGPLYRAPADPDDATARSQAQQLPDPARQSLPPPPPAPNDRILR